MFGHILAVKPTAYILFPERLCCIDNVKGQNSCDVFIFYHITKWLSEYISMRVTLVEYVYF